MRKTGVTILIILLVFFHFGCQKIKNTDNQGITSLTCVLDRPLSICGDDKDIFWIGLENVGKISKNGGTPVILADVSQDFKYIFTIDESYVYWTEDNVIKKVSKQGGKVDTLLIVDYEITELCADENAIYAKAEGGDPFFSGVVKIPKTNGLPFLLADIEWSGLGGEIILDGNYVYCGYSSFGTIYKVSTDNGFSFSFINNIDGPFTLDSDYFYWIFENNLYRKPKAGGLEQLLGNVGEYLQDYDITLSPGHLQVDQTHIYLLYGGLKGEAEGLIKKMPKGGGLISTMYSGLPEPWELYLDDNYLYWSDIKRDTHNTDCIRKAPK